MGVSITDTLLDQPIALLTSQYGYSANMERIMKSQAFADRERTQYLVSKKTVIPNPRHPMVSKLQDLVEEDKESENTKDLAWLLFDTATLNSGFSLEDASSFSKRMFNLMSSGMDLSTMELLDEIEVPEEGKRRKARARRKTRARSRTTTTKRRRSSKQSVPSLPLCFGDRHHSCCGGMRSPPVEGRRTCDTLHPTTSKKK